MALQQLRDRKAAIETRLDDIITAGETETRDLTDEESTELDALTVEHRDVKAKIEQLTSAAAARDERAKHDPFVQPSYAEERTAPYAEGGKSSYVKDLYLATQKQNRGALERLEVNDRHRADKARESKNSEVRAMSTIAGAGGEFAPPLWMVESFVGYKRPGRPTADIVQHDVLPEGVSSINLPTVTTGSLTGAQGTQNTAVANRDFVTNKVTGNVNTVAGQVVISQQELDQTPINLDNVILADLQADYDLQLDTAVIAAIVAAAGNTITYTNASPTSQGVLSASQQAIDAVHLGVFKPAQAAIMRPDRWGRFLAAADTSGRPLVLPTAKYGAFNSVGSADGQNAQGVAGDIRGISAILDAAIPNNLGAGTNQDEIIVLDPSQVWLYEGAPHAEVFKETYANQLSVLIRFYRYYSVIANRLPKAISVVVGTGMIPAAYGV